MLSGMNEILSSRDVYVLCNNWLFVPDVFSTDDDVCSLVYQDFFRILCTSQEDDLLLSTDAPIHTHTSFKTEEEESVEIVEHQPLPSLVECFCMKGCNGCEVEQARLLDQNFRNDYCCTEKIEQQYHQHHQHHHQNEKNNFRLNYTDVNLNTLWKKEQVLEDEVDDETEPMEGLEEPIRDEWKSATTMLFSPMSSDTERSSGFFSPIHSHDFTH